MAIMVGFRCYGDDREGKPQIEAQPKQPSFKYHKEVNMKRSRVYPLAAGILLVVLVVSG
jgi:hypothetical protein